MSDLITASSMRTKTNKIAQVKFRADINYISKEIEKASNSGCFEVYIKYNELKDMNSRGYCVKRFSEAGYNVALNKGVYCDEIYISWR